MTCVRSVWLPETASDIDEAPSGSLVYELCSLFLVCPSIFLSFASFLVGDAAHAALARACVLPAMLRRPCNRGMKTSSFSSSGTSPGGSSSSSGKDAQVLSKVSTSSSGTFPSMLTTNEKEAVLEASLQVSSRKAQDSSSSRTNKSRCFRVVNGGRQGISRT